MLLMISCRTTTETVYIIPDIEFPDYPDPKGKTSYDEKTKEVKMDLDYYADILTFKLKVQEAKKVYLKAKELYTEEKE